MACANQENLTVIQIETKEALEQVDAIAAVPGVDVLFIGPNDLSISLG
ncbi:MAG: aldolase/citrate lyase family protein [Caldilineaceae bacterium]